MSKSSTKKGHGSNWHPARISGIQKLARERQANIELKEKQKKIKLKPLDLTRADWSLKDL